MPVSAGEFASRPPGFDARVVGFAMVCNLAAVNATAQSTTLCILERTFARDPVSVQTVVRSDGTVIATEYVPARLSVRRVRSLSIPPDELARLNSRLEALTSQGGADATSSAKASVPADSYRLQCGARHWVGDYPAALPQLRDLLESMNNALRVVGVETALAGHYGRSEPIDESRLADIRRRGIIRFVEIDSLDPAVRKRVGALLASPREFLSLETAEFDALARLAAYGREIFLIEGSKAHQLVLFEADRLESRRLQ